MQLSINTDNLSFVCAGEAEADIDFKSGRPKTDPTGTPLFALRLFVMAGSEADVIKVKVPGQPVGVTPGIAVRVSGLTALPWDMGERSGVAYRVTRIEPAGPPARSDKGGTNS